MAGFLGLAALIAPGLAPQSQKQQQSAAQAPEQHGARLWNLMERLLHVKHSNETGGGGRADHIKGDVFGYIKRALRRNYGEKVVFSDVEWSPVGINSRVRNIIN